ncbi:MAG: MBL fold metallo-hydrolase, partial [Anaerolineae bacterium]|nr:MBL fold metallo-hydrolase [Anaerolineae bacterium]
HNHYDHVGGVDSVLQTGVQPTVYVPPSFTTLKQHIAQSTNVIDVERGMEVAPGIFTTGEMRGSPREQSLVIPTDDGIIVITGCAHPGIVAITAEAISLFENADLPVILAMGGFHLMEKSERQIDRIIEDLRDLGVQQVMPTHCTGDEAIARFAAVLGEDYIEGGVGRVIEFAITAEENEESDPAGDA